MRKEDLKDGMIVEVEFENIENERLIKLGDKFIGQGYVRLIDVTDELTLNANRDSKSKIIKVFKNKSMTCLKDINNDICLELIWERKREIDWSKVPKWTKVQVRDFEGEEWKNIYFINFSTNGIFKATYFDEFTFSEGDESEWYQCRIHPSVEIKEEWCK